jgi:hypothetical protein
MASLGALRVYLTERRSANRQFDTDPIRAARRQRGMPTPELISLIVALVVWIVLLGTFSTDA